MNVKPSQGRERDPAGENRRKALAHKNNRVHRVMGIKEERDRLDEKRDRVKQARKRRRKKSQKKVAGKSGKNSTLKHKD